MKTVLKTVLIISCVLLAITSSYAEDADMGKIVLSAEMKTISLSSMNYDSDAGERLSLSGDRKEIAGRFQRDVNDISHNSNMDIYNLPPSLINDIRYDFSHDGSRRSSGHSFAVLPLGLSDVFSMGAAFLTNLAIHEFGHEVVANYAGAEGSRMNFFEKSGGDFFLGTSSVENIDERSVLPYAMGGEVFADLTFEHALKGYRNNPGTYNKTLLFISGTDFLWYCFYAFYVSGDNPSYDPITIAEETGMSRDTLFSIALAKTLVNAYRVYSGNDALVPYFKVDKYSASLNFMIPIDIGG